MNMKKILILMVLLPFISLSQWKTLTYKSDVSNIENVAYNYSVNSENSIRIEMIQCEEYIVLVVPTYWLNLIICENGNIKKQSLVQLKFISENNLEYSYEFLAMTTNVNEMKIAINQSPKFLYDFKSSKYMTISCNGTNHEFDMSNVQDCFNFIK